MDERLKEIEEALNDRDKPLKVMVNAREWLRYMLDTIKEKDEAIAELHKYNHRYAGEKERYSEQCRYLESDIKRLQNELKLKQDALTVAGKRIDSYQD